MKHYEDTIVPVRTVRTHTHTTCDLCGKEIEYDRGDLSEVTIEHKTGYSWPEGGHGQTTSVHMCCFCFNSKLMPWFKSQGVKHTITEWDH